MPWISLASALLETALWQKRCSFLVPAAVALALSAGTGTAQEALEFSNEASAADDTFFSYGGPADSRPVLSGNWGGSRDSAAANGVTLDIFSTTFAMGVADGGLETGAVFNSRLDLYLNIDGEKAGLWQGLFLTFHGEALGGESPTTNENAGALFPPVFATSVPTGDPNELALTAAVVTQFLSEDHLVYFGKLNTVDDSNQPFVGGGMGLNGFMNASFLNSAVLARTVPYSTWGGGYVYLRDFEPIFSINVYDTNNTPTTLGWNEIGSNGATYLVQGRLPTNFMGKPGSHSLSLIHSSGNYIATRGLPESILGVILGELPALPREDSSEAVTYQFDQALWVDPANAERSFGVFGTLGLSDGNPNPIEWAASIGVAGDSPWGNRPGDSFGLGYFYTGITDEIKGLPGPFALQDEQGVEAFYNFGLAPWANLTADLQVIDPAIKAYDTEVIVGLRLKIDI
jgi:porin